MKRLSLGLLAILLAALNGCQLPEQGNLDQYRGDGLRVEVYDWSPVADSNEMGMIFRVFGGRPYQTMRLQRFKLYRAGDDRIVYQESPWYDLQNRRVSDGLGIHFYRVSAYPQLAFPSNWYGYVGVLVVGIDPDGKQVWGYDQVYIWKGELETRRSHFGD